MSDPNIPTDSGEREAPDMPAVIKQLAWLWHHTRENREVFTRPPVLALAAFVGFIGWWIGSTYEASIIREKDEQLTTRNDNITFLKDQLSAYSDRLHGASPDDAAKKIRELEERLNDDQKRLDVLYPKDERHLSVNEREFLTRNTERLKKDITSLQIFASPVGDSEYYANDFATLFLQNSLAVSGVNISACRNEDRGIIVGLMDIDHPSNAARDFTSVLSEGGFRPTHSKWYANSNTPQDFNLFVCPASTTRSNETPLSPTPPNTPEAK